MKEPVSKLTVPTLQQSIVVPSKVTFLSSEVRLMPLAPAEPVIRPWLKNRSCPQVPVPHTAPGTIPILPDATSFVIS